MIMADGYLLVTDFDGTAADTFQPNPKGIGVNEAYQLAVKEIFGETGLSAYNQVGGLGNRAPEELIALILETGEEVVLLQSAERCFDHKSKTLNRLVPEGKGAPLEWIPGDKNRLQRTIAELLVLEKLSCLMDEIGTEFLDGRVWPQPCAGFLEFFETVDKLKNSGVNIRLAIVSSGHDEFIKRTFSVWRLNSPDIIVTDDDMRGRRYPEDVERRVKPSSFLFDLVQSRWIGREILFSEYARHIELIIESRKRMMFFGDDPNKDSELAKNAGVPFGLFDPGKSALSRNGDNSFSFGSWTKVAEFFSQVKVKRLLSRGKPIREIVSLIN